MPRSTRGLLPWLLVATACGARTELRDAALAVGAGGGATSTTTTSPPDAGEDAASAEDAGACGVVDDAPPGWSTCVNATACFGSCADYCKAAGRVCRPVCTTSRGYLSWGAEAWTKGVVACSGEGAGQIDCDFTWDDEVGDAPRWRCCCQ